MKQIFMPQEVANLAIQEVEERKEAKSIKGLNTHISKLDEKLLPMRPGDLITIIGNSSNGKSLLMRWIASRNAKYFRERKQDEFAIYISYEQTVEQQGIQDMAEISGVEPYKMHTGTVSDAELDRLLSFFAQRAATPLAVIGHSSQHRKQVKQGRPMPTMEEVDDILTKFANEQNKRPSLVLIDYLQRIPLDKQWIANPTLGFSQNVDRAKDLAIKLSCPVVLGVQAKQEVVHRSWALPGMYDGMYTSNIAHSSDTVLSVWMPKTTKAIGEPLDGTYTGTQVIDVSKNLLVIGAMKQKWGEAPFWVFCEVLDDWASIQSMKFGGLS